MRKTATIATCRMDASGVLLERRSLSHREAAKVRFENGADQSMRRATVGSLS